MSDERGRPDSDKTRQELLDEIYYLRDVAGERERRCVTLQAKLDHAKTGHPWQLTAPLGAFTRWLDVGRRRAASASMVSRGNPGGSRQQLLDEIYRLRDVAGEREQQCTLLQARLALACDNRSWRRAKPLRAFACWLDAARGRVAPVRASSPTEDSITLPEVVTVTEPVKADAAPGIALARQADMRYLFVDVSELAAKAGRTGVQRVVREILRALLASPPDGFVVEPVAAAPGRAWRRAATIKAELTKDANMPISDAPVEMRAGDVFLGLDHSMSLVVDHAEGFAQMRAQGVRVWFECNDTLPLDHPEWFPPEVHERFKQWFQVIAQLGDGIACISRTTANDVRRWVDALEISRSVPLAIGCFAMGADLGAGEFRAALTDDEQAAIDRLPEVPRFLLVGTLEPRKGHEQALEAFNQLRADGVDIALVIVGFPGWMTEVVQRRIRHHDEFGKKVFWFMDASDALLEKLYASCSVLLAPAQGEGFGLPLIEAARHGLPILCRDLPVFREVAGEHAHYFAGPEPAVLAVAMRDWLEAHRRGNVPTSVGIACSTWVESARQLAMLVVGDSAEDNAAARLRTRGG